MMDVAVVVHDGCGRWRWWMRQ